MPGPFLNDDHGVSVIIGAMLLILITVIAAASLAMIVSQAEKQQAQRQAQIDAVNNEKLKIVSIAINNGSPAGTDINNLSVNILNLNTADSKVLAISVNGVYAKEFTSLDGTQVYDQNNPLVVPHNNNISVKLTLSDFYSTMDLKKDNTIKIELTTSLINYFSRVYNPPIALAKIDIASMNGRDYLILDGSGSSSDNGSVLSWTWTINDQKDGDPYTYTTTGRIVQAPMNSIGPFSITLKVTDDSSFTGQTVINMPVDQNLDMIKRDSASATVNDNGDLRVSVKDIYGIGLGGVYVEFWPDPGLSYDKLSAYTDQYGFAYSNHTNNAHGKVQITIDNASPYVPIDNGSPPIILNENIDKP